MIADLKPYKEYKESGVPWLGLVPERWVIKRGKSCSRLRAREKTGGARSREDREEGGQS